MSLRVKRSNLVLLLIFIPFAIYFRSLYRDRIGAFGCFDDCFNITAGYFINHGKHLYSEIFFNHQPLMAYLSAFIQQTTKPDVLYLLIYQHRMALIWFALAFDALLILRFGLMGFGFSLLYEGTKGYVFGDRFLAEAFIVYPLVYLVFLLFTTRKPVHWFESIGVALMSWFVIFSREPYVPLSLVLLWFLKTRISVMVFILLSLFTLAAHNVPDYFYNVVTLNRLTIAKTEVDAMTQTGGGLIPVIASPVMQFFGGIWNSFHRITAGLSALLLLSMFLFVRITNQWKPVLLAMLLLSLANIRPISPGQTYYAAFHSIVWYGVLIALVLIFLQFLVKEKKIFGIALWIAFVTLTVFVYVDPTSYLHEQVDRQTEFTTNYALYQSNGDIVSFLSTPADTLFLDGWDDLIYWQAKRLSPYPYSWFTSIMQNMPRFMELRSNMFANNPPDYYYGKCVKGVLENRDLPDDFSSRYIRLVSSGNPTCIFVKRSKMPEISGAQWDLVKKYGITKLISDP